MLLIDIYSWATQPAQNTVLVKQLTAAIATAAVQVIAESADIPNHAGRILWAKRVLATASSPGEMAQEMIWGLLGNGTIQADITATGTCSDYDVQYVVTNNLINVYAVTA